MMNEVEYRRPRQRNVADPWPPGSPSKPIAANERILLEVLDRTVEGAVSEPDEDITYRYRLERDGTRFVYPSTIGIQDKHAPPIILAPNAHLLIRREVIGGTWRMRYIVRFEET